MLNSKIVAWATKGKQSKTKKITNASFFIAYFQFYHKHFPTTKPPTRIDGGPIHCARLNFREILEGKERTLF